MKVTAVVPAHNEEVTVGDTVRALLALDVVDSVVVVDDGSRDETAREARGAGALVVRTERNRGKADALREGVYLAAGDVILLVDADVGSSAASLASLLDPVLDGRADMTVGIVDHVAGAGGLGLVKALAGLALRQLGAEASAPLSGQRVLTRDAWATLPGHARGWAVDLALSVGVCRAGLRCMEIRVAATHRPTRRDLGGYLHRGRQFRDILLYLLREMASRRLAT